MKSVETIDAGPIRYNRVGHDHVIGVSLFIVAEIMLFCGLIAAYLVLRGQAGSWPPAGQPRLPILMTAFDTAFLLGSGLTMWTVAPAMRAGDLARMRKLLLCTLGLGAAFLVVQGFEWLSMIHYGMTTGASLYGSTFYAIIGCHGLHVIGGLAAVAVMTRRVIGEQRRRSAKGPREVTTFVESQQGPLFGARLFWLFVVVVWVPLYLMVYVW